MSLEPPNGLGTTTQDVLTHHSNAFGDIDRTMEDFTAESKLFTPEGVLRGPEAIRGFFERLFAEFAKPGASFEMLREEVEGEVAYLVWKAETADHRYELGTDTYIVRNGKIVTQTFAAKAVPKR